MNYNEVQTILRQHRPELDACGVASIGIFGSVARGDAHERSDVDVLVEFAGPASFDRYMDVVLLLQEWLGRRVDVITPRSLARRPEWRDQVLAEVRRVA